jgi:hypothetical protein
MRAGDKLALWFTGDLLASFARCGGLRCGFFAAGSALLISQFHFGRGCRGTCTLAASLSGFAGGFFATGGEFILSECGVCGFHWCGSFLYPLTLCMYYSTLALQFQ